MKIQIDNQTGPLARLQTWRDKKYQEIDEEYNRKVKDFKTVIFKYDKQISQMISNIQELRNKGDDVSIDQIQQLQKQIGILKNQINDILMDEPKETINELNLAGRHIRSRNVQYLVKAKVTCNNTDLYALESEKCLPAYNGLCPICRKPHVLLERNRGFYAKCDIIHAIIHN
ncbi:unnamed protein product [Adineta steineri]|uniref:Uncharacterized protein n=1 Tax=Adineta steineri TaxID=433720 RepID=A0A815PYQ5_9BILA|nr:unnamed protein product [Adineta steineri]CAF1266160.1 unnamed protein product [Adineta steineri]CAF1455803.1 unnamed protein product [Adineta steineri]CAF4008352.1 unnamed protein product [Adineta steineri]CAF4027298.1 unnamed protein product [Adineta steineri]